jgi:hypothetical protein
MTITVCTDFVFIRPLGRAGTQDEDRQNDR